MYLTTQGLVIRVTPYNDTDALLTLLTPNHGKLTVKARGLTRKNSSLVAPCQLLAYGEFTLFEYRNFYTINEAYSIALFSGLRRDLLKLSLGTYFAQVAEVLSQEDLPNPELLSLTLNCLHALEKIQIPIDQIKAVFELRSACIAGYTPDLNCCHICGHQDADRLNIMTGLLECSGCRQADSQGIRMQVTAGMLEAMRYICDCEPKKLFHFTLGEDALAKLSYVTEGYLSTQLERGFSTLDFYKELLIPLDRAAVLGEENG